MYSADAQAKQYKYAAAVDMQNKGLELKARDDANRRGEMESMRHWRKVSQMEGAQRAQMGASMLDLGFGSPADILDETMSMGFEDAAILEENRHKEAQGYEINAVNYGNSAKANKANAKAAKTSGYIAAAGTLLSAASQIGGNLSGGGAGGSSSLGTSTGSSAGMSRYGRGG